MKVAIHVPYTDADRRYWRSRGNRRIRKKRMARHTLRWAALIAVHLIVVGALAVAAGQVARHVTRSSEFALSEVRVDGLARVTDEEIHRMLLPYLQRNLLDLDLDTVAAAIEREPWVREARVRRVLPRSLHVAIRERVPVARIAGGTEPLLVDEDGVVLPDRTGTDGEGLPWVVADGDGRPGGATVRAALAGLRRLHRERPDWYPEVDAITVADGALGVVLVDGERVLLDPDRPERNLDEWLALRGEIGRRVGAAETVDLRWRGRIAVRPAVPDENSTEMGEPVSDRTGR